MTLARTHAVQGFKVHMEVISIMTVEIFNLCFNNDMNEAAGCPELPQVAEQIAQHQVRKRADELLRACRPILAVPLLLEADVNAARALERVCEVASRVLELIH